MFFKSALLSGALTFIPSFMPYSVFKFKRFIAAFSVFIFLSGSLAPAVEALGFVKDEPVSRAVFIEAAVKSLDQVLPESEQVNLPYGRVPPTIAPELYYAHKKGALQVFGDNLYLARNITRGEALYVMGKLLDKQATTKPDYPDIKSSFDSYAVAVSLENDWLPARRSALFGVDELLQPGEAIVMIRKITGVQYKYIDFKDINEKEEERETKQPSGPTINIRIGQASDSQEALADIVEGEDLIGDIWELLSQTHINADKFDVKEANDKARKAFVDALADNAEDPYTVYMPKQEAEEFVDSIEGELTGIGARVEYVNEELQIVSPMEDSPAQAAGLKPGDIILKIKDPLLKNLPEADENGWISLKGIGLMNAVRYVRGPKGSQAELLIRREGFGQYNFKIIRDVIKVPEVKVDINGSVLIIKLYQFGAASQNELPATLVKFKEEYGHKLSGIILDMRNNPGGLLDSAIDVIANFVPKGSRAVEMRAGGLRGARLTEREPVFPNLPMAVLVNKGSASASEVVAGALQDLQRATIIGEKTFGKGTVQTLYGLMDESQVKVTTAEWYTPGNSRGTEPHTIEGTGIDPDILVENKDSDRDDQLIRALQLLR